MGADSAGLAPNNPPVSFAPNEPLPKDGVGGLGADSAGLAPNNPPAFSGLPNTLPVPKTGFGRLPLPSFDPNTPPSPLLLPKDPLNEGAGGFAATVLAPNTPLVFSVLEPNAALPNAAPPKEGAGGFGVDAGFSVGSLTVSLLFANDAPNEGAGALGTASFFSTSFMTVETYRFLSSDRFLLSSSVVVTHSL